MILYYNKEGILKCMLTHGSKPRQGSDLSIEILFDEDIEDYENMGVNLRYRRPNKNYYEGDVPFEEYINEDDFYIFHSFGNEDVGPLIDGKAYRCFKGTFSYSKLNCAGFLEVTPTINIFEPVEENVSAIKKTLTLGKAKIFIEETLGLDSQKGIGMDLTEYESLMSGINDIKKRNKTYEDLVDTFDGRITNVENHIVTDSNVVEAAMNNIFNNEEE